MHNIDETGVSTVAQSANNVAQIGKKLVGQAVCGEQGNVITVGMIIRTAGNNLPADFIYPRAIFPDYLMFVAQPGSLGMVISPLSSWIRGPLLLKVLEIAK